MLLKNHINVKETSVLIGRGEMLTTLMYDVEDLVSEESDDVALWLAEMLHKEGLQGSFFVVGEKARLWERRGRLDVIESLKYHDISYHSTSHSVHPTISEVCQDLSFMEGVRILRERESQGWADLERICGRPLSGWGTTGSSWAPSLAGLMASYGRASMYSHVSLPGCNVVWFGGCLNFSHNEGGFDDTFYDDGKFEARLNRLKEEVRTADPSKDWFGIFVCHPTKVISEKFWDVVNFAAGANPPREGWVVQPLRPQRLIPTMQGNYRRLLDYIRSEPKLEVAPFSEAIREFDHQYPYIPHRYLLEVCAQVDRFDSVLFKDEFTASELMLAMCEAASAPQLRYVRRSTFGPDEMPPQSKVSKFRAKDVIEGAPQVLASVAASGHLPHLVTVGGEGVGIGTFFVALAKTLLGKDEVGAPGDVFYPPEAEEIGEYVRKSVPPWPIHPPDLRMDKIVLHTRLQCWSLKKAHRRDMERVREFYRKYGFDL